MDYEKWLERFCDALKDLGAPEYFIKEYREGGGIMFEVYRDGESYEDAAQSEIYYAKQDSC